MKRFAALALVLSLAAIPACAQRGGSRGGSSGGFAGRSAPAFHSSFSGPGNFSSAPRGYAFAPSYVRSSIVSAAPAYRGGVAATRPVFYGDYRGRRPQGYRGGAPYSYGYPYGYGYGGSSVFLSPYELGYPDFSGYTDDDGYDNSEPAAAAEPDASDAQGYVDTQTPYAGEQPYAGSQSYAGAQRDAGGQPYPNESGQAPYAPSAPPYAQAYAPPPAPQSQPAAASPPPEDSVTIIFKDGHSEQIHNYALTRTTLYVTGRRVHDIPLAQIDLPATQKANLAAGVDFQLPTAQ